MQSWIELKRIISFYEISWILTVAVGLAEFSTVGDVVGETVGPDIGEDVGVIGLRVGDFVGYLLKIQ